MDPDPGGPKTCGSFGSGSPLRFVAVPSKLDLVGAARVRGRREAYTPSSIKTLLSRLVNNRPDM
jgi:hypothetical protein